MTRKVRVELHLVTQQTQLQAYCSFFFNDTATTEFYTLSLHDALPICQDGRDAPRDDVPEQLERDLGEPRAVPLLTQVDRKSTRLNSSHPSISYAVFCLKKKNTYWR